MEDSGHLSESSNVLHQVKGFNGETLRTESSESAESTLSFSPWSKVGVQDV